MKSLKSIDRTPVPTALPTSTPYPSPPPTFFPTTVPTIRFPGRPRALQVVGFDEVIRLRPNGAGDLGALIGASVLWLAPAVGGAPIEAYELSSRVATSPNATAKTAIVALSSYDDDMTVPRSEGGQWTIASSHINADARKEAEGHVRKGTTFYEWYVPRLKCSTDYVFSVRASNAFHGYGSSWKVLVATPSCSPTTEPSFPPTTVAQMAP